MVDVATLGIAVDTSDLEKGTRALHDFGQQSETVTQKVHEAEKGFEEMGHVVSEVKSTLVEFAAILGVSMSFEKVYQMAEAWESAQTRLEAFSSSAEEANASLQGLMEVSDKTRTSLAGNVDVFQRLLIVNQSVGASTQELTDFTQALSASMTLMGRDSADTAQVITFLSRAMQMGAVDGRLMRTVLSEMAPLAQEMAKQFGDGTEGTKALIESFKDGTINARDFMDMIANLSPKMTEQVALMRETVPQASHTLGNAFTQLFGEINDDIGITDHLARAVLGLRDAIKLMADEADKNAHGPSMGFFGGIAALGTKVGSAIGLPSMFMPPGSAGGGGGGVLDVLPDVSEITQQYGGLTKELHLTAKEWEDLNKAVKEGSDAQQENTDKLIAFIEQLNIEKFIKEDNHQLDVEIHEDMKKITDETLRLEAKKQSAYVESGRVADRINREIAKVSLDVSNEIGNTFFDMIDGQKDAWSSLKNYVVRMLEQMAAAALINPIIQPIITTVIGSAIGALGASTAGAMFGSSIGGFGAGAGLSGFMGESFADYGGVSSLGLANPGMFSAGMGALGAGAIGYVGGSLIGGALGLNSQNAGIGGGIGAAAGMFFGGPLGALAGGALGTLLGGAFGPGPSNQTEGSILNFGQGTFSTGTSPLPGSSKYDAGNASAASNLTSGALGLYNALKSVGMTPGVGSLLVEASAGLHGSPFDAAVDGSGKQGFSDAASAGKWIAQQILGSLSNIPVDFQKLIDNIDYSNLDDFVKQLNDLAGFHAALSGIQDQILQMKDPKAYALKQLDAQFQPLIDAANKYGQGLADIEELYGLKRQQILDQFGQKSVDTVQKTVDQINADLSKSFDGQIKIYNDQISAVDNLKQSWAALSSAFAATASGLQLDPSLSILNPEGRRSEAFNQLDAAVARYKGGDMSAAQDIQSLAKEALTASRDVYASSQQYTEDFNRVMGILADAHSSADTQVSLASSQLNVLIQIRDALTSQRSLIPGSPGASYTASDLDALNAAYAGSQSASGMSPGDFANSPLGQGYTTQLIAEIGGVTDIDRLKSDYKSLSADPGNATWAKIAGVIGSRLRQLGVPGYAMGTGSAIGGLSIVGEQGPELVNLPGGSQVASSGQTSNILNFDPKAMTSRQDLTTMTLENGFKGVVIELRAVRNELGTLTRRVQNLAS